MKNVFKITVQFGEISGEDGKFIPNAIFSREGQVDYNKETDPTHALAVISKHCYMYVYGMVRAEEVLLSMATKGKGLNQIITQNDSGEIEISTFSVDPAKQEGDSK